jgi:hypothetical protein
MKTPTWKATQNQMFVDTAQTVPCGEQRRNGKAVAARASTFLSPTIAFSVACSSRMDAELEKLVESGKITARSADQLEKLKPGTFCLHKSWGFGRVAEWNLLLNQILIDFPGKKAHGMQLTYAAENLAVIPPEHFLAKRRTI